MPIVILYLVLRLVVTCTLVVINRDAILILICPDTAVSPCDSIDGLTL